MTQKTVIRLDLYKAVYEKTGLSHARSAKLVELVFKEIIGCLERGQPVNLSSVGSFIVRNKRQRMWTNRKTGEAVPDFGASGAGIQAFKSTQAAHQCRVIILIADRQA